MIHPRVRKSLLSYGLLMPAFIVSTALIVFPLIVTFSNSLKPGASMNFSKNWAIPYSFSRYKEVITDARTWMVMLRSFVYLFGSLFPSYLLGLATALLLNRKFPGRRVFRTLAILPWAIPGVVASIMFVWMFDSTYGVMNFILTKLRIIDEYKLWFYDPSLVMFSVILPTIWKGYPFFTISILASLQSISLDYYEAAEVDGCGAIRKFLHITWPGIKETSVLSLILNGLWSFRVFDIIYSTTKGGPNEATTTIAIQIYNEAFQYFDINKASILGVLAFFVSAIIVFIFYPIMNKETQL
ncbi:carbohydrate ABC transporter permease [Breznakiella homolactica]|uniref:Sugar ABC transporter permease n=1 Tax=Breznakiella homolactica TaxID=2798577 RepID=A0A7T7XJM0_9SPIR|nr:sugar ABC transporter permease [Breznakiella homolactica]QQO07495.1 sugar ABC transporter permease [Breznakiella homolactica]